MSATNKKDLQYSFSHFASIFDIPSDLRQKMESIIWDNINNKRVAVKNLEALLPNTWTSQSAQDALIARGERFPYLKEQLNFIVGKIICLAHINRQFRDATNTKSALPYLKIEQGPTIIECPIHSSFFGKLYEVSDDFWSNYPVGKDIDCSCTVRGVTKYEFNNSH